MYVAWICLAGMGLVIMEMFNIYGWVRRVFMTATLCYFINNLIVKWADNSSIASTQDPFPLDF